MRDIIGSVFVGADVLEIMSVAMYADPLVVYRELVQNAADAIDEAERTNLLKQGGGTVRVSFEKDSRRVSIIDNGVGLPNELFSERMLAFGASSKRHDTYRGFRGIGRLAGLGHCRELVFRSRSEGDQFVAEARWDGVKVRELMLGADIVPLEHLARESVAIRHTRAEDEPSHFFEVRMEGVRRLGDDRLYDPTRIIDFLSQVAPVPFSPDFSKAAEIRTELLRRAPLLEIALHVAGVQVFKPYRDTIEVRAGRFATIRDIEPIELPAVDASAAAFGWIAHHDYLGALKAGFPARGLRVRSGNLQIGDDTVLSPAFPEERFNAWAIGEFHVFDPRLRPNARRDAFEPSVHVDNLFNQLRPYGAAIAKRCRTESKQRNTRSRLEAIVATLDVIEPAMRRNKTTLADAVRSLVAEDLIRSVADLRKQEGATDSSALRAMANIERRIDRLAERRSARRTLSDIDKGRFEILARLHMTGHAKLLAEIMSTPENQTRSRRRD